MDTATAPLPLQQQHTVTAPLLRVALARGGPAGRRASTAKRGRVGLNSDFVYLFDSTDLGELWII
jgi:hypothetical protein